MPVEEIMDKRHKHEWWNMYNSMLLASCMTILRYHHPYRENQSQSFLSRHVMPWRPKSSKVRVESGNDRDLPNSNSFNEKHSLPTPRFKPNLSTPWVWQSHG